MENVANAYRRQMRIGGRPKGMKLNSLLIRFQNTTAKPPLARSPFIRWALYRKRTQTTSKPALL